MTILRRIKENTQHYVECPVCKERTYTRNTTDIYYHYVLTDDDNELVKTEWDSGTLSDEFNNFNGEVVEMSCTQLDNVKTCAKCGGTVR